MAAQDVQDEHQGEPVSDAEQAEKKEFEHETAGLSGLDRFTYAKDRPKAGGSPESA